MAVFTKSELLKDVHHTFLKILNPETDKQYFKDLLNFLNEEVKEYEILPPKDKIFHWASVIPSNEVKVVIFGQDPYPTPGHANGLAFSAAETCNIIPNSLTNIYKELESDIADFKKPNHGHLKNWCLQGVLLLNAVLTLRAKDINSHKGKGWELLTDAVVNYLCETNKNLVFILWGEYAQEKGKLIDETKHDVIKCAHPSPVSASSGFFGSKCFSRCNEYLKSKGNKPIDWSNL